MSSELLLHRTTKAFVHYFGASNDRAAFLTVQFLDNEASSVKMFFDTADEARKIMQEAMDGLDKHTNEDAA